MVSEALSNYPDLLGAVTGGKRANIGPLQAALAVRPRVLRAGRPFDLLMLIQNASDIELEVRATVSLPAVDAKKQKGRFISKAELLTVRLDAAGVGVVLLPVSTLPDTAVSDQYRVGIDLETKPIRDTRPNRIRKPEGGGTFDESLLHDETPQIFADLKTLTWTANISGLRKTTLETSLTVMSGTVGKLTDLEPSWRSLWTLQDYQDETFLFSRYAPLIISRILPQFKRADILPIIHDYSQKFFANIGYKVDELELDLITRLITLILEYANPAEKDMRFLGGADYSIKQYFDEHQRLIRIQNALKLPHWMKRLLIELKRDERAALIPVKAVAHFGYADLLRDAMLHSFDHIEHSLGINVGDEQERAAYVDHALEAYAAKQASFDTIYMPLVIGAISLADVLAVKGEKAQDLLQNIRALLDRRKPQLSADDQAIFDMALKMVDLITNKYKKSEW